jgi:hypothetical protein
MRKRISGVQKLKLVVLVAVTLSLVLGALAQADGPDNLLRNGNFEEGFAPNNLAFEWESFDNGDADFSFHIDDWPLVVPEGEFTQMLEIKDANLPDRYLGIYQTADVEAGGVYTFSMQGLVRTNTGNVEETSYGYRLQVGFDLEGGQDWEAVDEWVELMWDEQKRLQDEFRFDEYTTTLTAESDQLTVFIRAWKKWADAGEGDYDIDDVQLVAAEPGMPAEPLLPISGETLAAIWGSARWWATIALLLLLLGGAFWGLRRRQTA